MPALLLVAAIVAALAGCSKQGGGSAQNPSPDTTAAKGAGAQSASAKPATGGQGASAKPAPGAKRASAKAVPGAQSASASTIPSAVVTVGLDGKGCVMFTQARAKVAPGESVEWQLDGSLEKAITFALPEPAFGRPTVTLEPHQPVTLQARAAGSYKYTVPGGCVSKEPVPPGKGKSDQGPGVDIGSTMR